MHAKKIVLKIIKLYQMLISPLFGRNCRFYPSCSEYTYRAVEKYGVLKGIRFGFKRILRCNPWHPGGIDEI